MLYKLKRNAVYTNLKFTKHTSVALESKQIKGKRKGKERLKEKERKENKQSSLSLVKQ